MWAVPLSRPVDALRDQRARDFHRACACSMEHGLLTRRRATLTMSSIHQPVGGFQEGKWAA